MPAAATIEAMMFFTNDSSNLLLRVLKAPKLTKRFRTNTRSRPTYNMPRLLGNANRL
jgi:hypothetical protein